MFGVSRRGLLAGIRFGTHPHSKVCLLARPIASTQVGHRRGNRVEHVLSVRNRRIHLSQRVGSPVVPFNLPDVGEAITTVEIKEWLVKVGDTVSMGDPVCEVQSDKSAVTVYSPFDGVVKELLYAVDDLASQGKPLVMIEVKGSEESKQEDQRQQTESTTSSGQEPTTTTATDTTPTTTTTTASVSSGSGGGGGGGKVLAAPAVRKIAADRGLDLSTVKGTGRDGRITKEDILCYLEAKEPPIVQPPVIQQQHPPSPVEPSPQQAPPTVQPGDKTVPVRGYKAVMVRTMTASGNVPQFGYCDEVNMSRLVELRWALKREMKERGVNFSYMPVLIKALSLALLQYPILNSSVSQDCSSITVKASHNIGVAMDTSEGLVVPNIKSVEKRSVFEIAAELNRLHELGLSGRLPPKDVAGGTFSLSNIGAVGGTYARPMLLPPEVAIGAFGRVQEVPRFDRDGNVRRVHLMCVSWSADHRVIDGATVSRFSNLWKSYVENPASMIADLK